MEQWKLIEGYETSYEVSNYGRVRSLDRFVNHRYGQMLIKGKHIKKRLNTQKYEIVGLSKNNYNKTTRVHRLVAKAFIPNPDNKPQVNHIDGNKQNNHIDNLEWSTAKENSQHAYDTGLNTHIKKIRYVNTKRDPITGKFIK